MPPKDELNKIADFQKEAFSYMLEVMNDLTDGAFKKNYRQATAAERVMEWDSLTADQINQLIQSKGKDWVMKQGGEIERLRKQVKL